MLIEEWNKIPKDKETDVTAIEGDICTVIDGVAFLVQRTNDFNNVVCIRIAEPKQSILKTFCQFRAWCEQNKIQYFRVEGGNNHKYKLLYLVSREGQKQNKACNVVYDIDTSAEYNRYIYYVKAY